MESPRPRADILLNHTQDSQAGLGFPSGFGKRLPYFGAPWARARPSERRLADQRVACAVSATPTARAAGCRAHLAGSLGIDPGAPGRVLKGVRAAAVTGRIVQRDRMRHGACGPRAQPAKDERPRSALVVASVEEPRAPESERGSGADLRWVHARDPRARCRRARAPLACAASRALVIVEQRQRDARGRIRRAAPCMWKGTAST